MWKISYKRRSIIWIVATLAAVVLLAHRGFKVLLTNSIELRRLQKEYRSLVAEEKGIKSQLDRMNKSDFAIESAARRELGFVKKGELEYRFPPPAGNQKAPE